MNEQYLEHYGVKGMHWGVRRQAKKDAKEYARAKMYYGEGAGIRRRHINAQVNERSKDPVYKQYFDHYSSKQDMSKHAVKAQKERRREDTKESVKKTGKGIVNILTDHPERLGAGMAATYTTYNIAKRYGVTDKLAKAGQQTVKSIQKSKKYRNTKKTITKNYARTMKDIRRSDAYRTGKQILRNIMG